MSTHVYTVLNSRPNYGSSCLFFEMTTKRTTDGQTTLATDANLALRRDSKKKPRKVRIDSRSTCLSSTVRERLAELGIAGVASPSEHLCEMASGTRSARSIHVCMLLAFHRRNKTSINEKNEILTVGKLSNRFKTKKNETNGDVGLLAPPA